MPCALRPSPFAHSAWSELVTRMGHSVQTDMPPHHGRHGYAVLAPNIKIYGFLLVDVHPQKKWKSMAMSNNQMVSYIIICIYIYIWVNYNNSLTWILRPIWGWFPYTFTRILVRSKWGRYNLPRYMKHIEQLLLMTCFDPVVVLRNGENLMKAVNWHL